MNRMIRRSMIGILAGGAASAALIATVGHAGISLLLGAAIGAAFAASTGPTPGAYLDNMMMAALSACPSGEFSVSSLCRCCRDKCLSGARRRCARTFPPSWDGCSMA